MAFVSVLASGVLPVAFVNCSGFDPKAIQGASQSLASDDGTDNGTGDPDPSDGGSVDTPVPTPVPTPGPTPIVGPGATPTPTPGPGKAEIRYVGRFDFSNSQGARFAWSGSTIEAAFTGTSLSAKIKSPGEIYFTVLIDNAAPKVLKVTSAAQDYSLATGLSSGLHTVKLVRNTEANQGVTQFLGFQYSSGGGLAVLSTRDRVKMEVIGDSITCGYGNTGAGPNCPFTPATENNYLAYGSVAARLLDADVTTVSISGRGVYHNYGAQPNDPNNPTMPYYYGFTLPPISNPGAGTFTYDFSKQEPMDVVVVNLGTNDFSLNPPDSATFAQAYKSFLIQIRAKNPNARIFGVVGSMISEPTLTTWRNGVQSAISSLQQAGDPYIYFVEFPAQDGSRGIGCDWHPSAAQHEYMGQILANSIKQVLGL